MKTVSATFIALSLATAGVSYLYTSNQQVRQYVSKAIHSRPKADSFSVSAPTDTIIETRSRIPKKLLPDIFSEIDDYAKKTPKLYEKDIRTLAGYLIKPAGSEIEKARALYTWVSTHIMYDDAAYNSGNYPDYSAENVLRRKKAVCEGYANLLKALCDAAGLESEKVSGYAKGYGYKAGNPFSSTNHAWNVIKINDTWKLFDATWGSTFGKNINGKLVSTSHFNPYWFDVHPKAFIFSHLPKEEKWQFLESPLTLRMYEKFPYAAESFFKLGFDPESVYNDVVSQKVIALVTTYALEFPAQCSKLPYTQTISGDKEILFEIESDYAETIAVIDNSGWHYFTKEDNKFTLTHKPMGKEMKISVKINWFDKSFSSIVKYKVSTPNKNSL